ncbi:L-aminoadipate-semialdehyde dehydrogenase large subunit [Madurella mycetomatis]|uniref:L-aminoadipate-semialdehyde dehydrogenase large subunit n=1 Tax=Madurella mycetomatis TaxID=100816 RepID=A0A175WG44_9PEZI|nr:L-aminoadipate-semialdehyde dehydrogenase large subunit [Madurella mycetomatis]
MMATATTNGVHVRPFIRPTTNYASPQKLEGFLHSLPELVDFNAANNAAHPFCIQAKPTPPFDTITHGEFKVAVSRCAAWLKENLPLGPALMPTSLTKMAPVALLMESDFGLVVHEFALMSLGVPPLVLSPRLPPVAIGALLQQTGATSFIVSQRLSEPAKPALGALAAKGIATRVANPYESFYEKGADAAAVPLFEPPEDVDDVILLLHSSGTTGLPKPIPLTHRQLLFAVNCHKFDTEEQAQGLNLSTLPLFHGFGLVAPGLSMSAGKTALYPVSDGIPSALSIVKLIKETNPKSMMTVPFLLDDMVNLPDDEGIKVLAHMDFVGTGGAALGAGVGDRLAAGGVKLLNFYGTTETGPLSLTFAPSDTNYDWKYFRLRTDVKYKVDELDVTSDDGSKRYRLTVWAHPAGRTEGFEIPDQLIRNEQYPETDFAAVGRADDIIVLATGEKANPLILETMLSEAPLIKSAIAFGENQFHLGVIIEPLEPLSAEQEAVFREKVWPIANAAGQKMDAFARVPSPDAIIFVPNGVVIPRTDKGSIARKETYALLDKEIKAVYEKLQQAATDATGPLDMDNLEENLKELFHKTLSLRIPEPLPEWTIDDNLFDLGVDSLQALQLRRVLIAAASKTEGLKDNDAAKLISPEFFYANPSVREMATVIRDPSSSPGGQDTLDVAAKQAQELVDLYSLSAPSPALAEKQQPSNWDNAVVLLSGSSGSLGSHILAELARHPRVQRIICLVRKEKGTNAPPVPGGGQFDRQILKARGLELSEQEWAKVVTLEVDPTADKLGLFPMVYAGMQARVTHVIHAAWPMNYLMKLRSFRYQFKFLRNLVEFAAGAKGPAKGRFVFISSIAAAARAGLSNPGSPVPETPVSPVDAACGIGYADAKLVCEKMLERAAETYASQLEIAYIRCGQIAGAKASGAWNASEQIPMLLKSAQSVGALPQLGGELSWIPVDDAAKVVVEVASSSQKPPIVLHLENPVRQPWDGVMKTVGEELGIAKSLPFDEWLDRVQGGGAGEDGELYPVKKLYAFFKHSFRAAACGQVVLGTDVARAYSNTLCNMRAVDDTMVRNYVGYWKDIEFLSK